MERGGLRKFKKEEGGKDKGGGEKEGEGGI